MDLTLDIVLTQNDKRRMVRPIAELIPATRLFWAAAVGVVPLTILIACATLQFWPAMFVVGFSALLLLLHRLGPWNPSLERRMDALVGLQRIPDEMSVRITDGHAQTGGRLFGRRIRWSNVKQCEISPTEVVLTRYAAVIVIPATAFAIRLGYDDFVEFVRRRVPAESVVGR